MFNDDPFSCNCGEVSQQVSGDSKAGILAQTLAWAARYGIAFDFALLSLTERGVPASRSARLKLSSSYSMNWNARLVLAALDVRAGLPLYQALRRQLHYFLPEYFLLAVEQAENRGHLAAVLPCFAQRLNLVSDRRSRALRGLFYPSLEFVGIITVSSFIAIFIFPRFMRIFEEMAPDASLSAAYHLTSFICQNVYAPYAWEIIALLGLIAYVVPRYLLPLIEGGLLKVPVMGRMLEQAAMLELAGGMGAFLASGEDVARAGEFCRQATRRPWLKKRLARFTEEVRGGKPWIDCWDELKLGTPLHRWMIRNAAAREKPVEGFDQLLIWLVLDYKQTSRLLVRIMELAGIVFNGILVVLMGLAIFGMLTGIVHYWATVVN